MSTERRIREHLGFQSYEEAAETREPTYVSFWNLVQSTKGIGVDMLHDASQWWLHPECLKAANRVLVDHHHHVELSGAWGEHPIATAPFKMHHKLIKNHRNTTKGE